MRAHHKVLGCCETEISGAHGVAAECEICEKCEICELLLYLAPRRR